MHNILLPLNNPTLIWCYTCLIEMHNVLMKPVFWVNGSKRARVRSVRGLSLLLIRPHMLIDVLQLVIFYHFYSVSIWTIYLFPFLFVSSRNTTTTSSNLQKIREHQTNSDPWVPTSFHNLIMFCIFLIQFIITYRPS